MSNALAIVKSQGVMQKAVCMIIWNIVLFGRTFSAFGNNFFDDDEQTRP